GAAARAAAGGRARGGGGPRLVRRAAAQGPADEHQRRAPQESRGSLVRAQPPLPLSRGPDPPRTAARRRAKEGSDAATDRALECALPRFMALDAPDGARRCVLVALATKSPQSPHGFIHS